MNKKSDETEVKLSWFSETVLRFKRLYVELIFIAICLRLLGLVEPFIFQVIIDRVLPFERESTLISIVLIFALTSFFQVNFSVLSSFLGVITANKITHELGYRIFCHLFRLPLSFFRRWSVGELVARVSETDRIRDFLVSTTTGAMLDGIFIIVYISILYALSPELAAVLLFFIPLQIFIYFGFGPFLRKRMRAQFDFGAKYQKEMVENISEISTIKSLSAEKKIYNQLSFSLLKFLKSHQSVNVISTINRQAIFALNRALTITIIFIGSGLVFESQITLGELIAFHLIAEKVAAPISNFTALWENWQNVRVSKQRLGNIINSKAEPFDLLPRLPQGIESRLCIKNINFSYSEDKLILQNFSFEAAPNTLSVIIGSSGIGKSTFGRVAAGIETPSSGIVTLDGNDISQFDPHDVRLKIAYVPQEASLFSGSLKDNLTFGVDQASEEDIQRALDVVSGSDIVSQLPYGLETFVGERGLVLSGGQRQRIAIARSLLLKPKVLILDEPTSALDVRNQSKMVKNLENLSETMTIIVITHRPEIFENYSQVIDIGDLR